jgi:hypothetical protein
MDVAAFHLPFWVYIPFGLWTFLATLSRFAGFYVVPGFPVGFSLEIGTVADICMLLICASLFLNTIFFVDKVVVGIPRPKFAFLHLSNISHLEPV